MLWEVSGSATPIVEPGGALDVMAVGTNGHLYQFGRNPTSFVWSALLERAVSVA